MAKKVIFNDEAKSGMFAGIEKLAKAVMSTMGPTGRNVILSRTYGVPVVTNDGVTIAREIELEDPLENMGAQLIKEAATKTNDVAGDGTSSSTLLAYAMIKEGLKNVAAGANPMIMRKGMEKAVQTVVEGLDTISKKITTKEEIEQVATISAQDPEVGKLIAEIMEQVGNEGVITIEEGQTFGLSKKVVEGMQFNNGYISPYMVTDPARMEATYEDVQILLVDSKITSVQDLLPIVEKVATSGRKNLVIIAEDISGDALSTLVLNKVRGTFNTLAIKTPGFGERRKEMLKDIASVIGATIISDEIGLSLKDATLDYLGQARRVVSDKDSTTIIEGMGSPEAVSDRINLLKTQLSSTTSDYEKQALLERLAKLSGGVGVIEVGAATEVELKEKKHRIEDALSATRAAVDEGIVAGGGTALLKCAFSLDSIKEGLHSDEVMGINLVQKALEYPCRQIASNAGVEGSVIVEKVIHAEKTNEGYDASTHEICDLVERGIIDPKKVTRSALQNAVSVASMFLTTEAAIYEIPKEKVQGHEHAQPMY